MKLLLTGAGGFIGAATLPALLADFEVLALTRRMTPSLEALARRSAKLRVKVGTLRDLTQVDVPVDGIVHAAAATPGPDLTVDNAIQANVIGTVEVRDFARKAGCKSLVYLSSLSVYGRIEADVVGPDTSCIDPDFYGLTKRLGELALCELAGRCGISVLRMPGVVADAGARTRSGQHAIWLGRVLDALQSGAAVKISNGDLAFNNVLHTADLASLIRSILLNVRSGVHVATPAARDPLPLRSLIENMRRAVGSSSEIVDTGPAKPCFSISSQWKLPGVTFDPMTVADSVNRFCRANP